MSLPDQMFDKRGVKGETGSILIRGGQSAIKTLDDSDIKESVIQQEKTTSKVKQENQFVLKQMEKELALLKKWRLE